MVLTNPWWRQPGSDCPGLLSLHLRCPTEQCHPRQLAASLHFPAAGNVNHLQRLQMRIRYETTPDAVITSPASGLSAWPEPWGIHGL